jgi:SH3-like domain-containing protein
LLAAHLLRARGLVLPAALAAFAFALAAGAIATGAAAWHRIALRRAVVVAASAPAREGPADRASVQFEVHEGTPLRVEDEAQGFRRVKLLNGLSGWVPAGAVEMVVPPAWSGANG